jgi:acylphosphatase
MKKSVNIRVKGRVQGVWFRKNAKEQALSLQLLGYVRNELDGSVFIEAEGSPESIDALIEWCHHGPELAEVEEVLVTETEPKGYQAFVIQH